MVRRKHKSEPVDPRPVMPRGDTEQEEARINTDFVAVYKQIVNTDWEDSRESYEYAYRAGRSAERAQRNQQ